MRRLPAALLALGLACASGRGGPAPAAPGGAEASAREILRRFATALDAGRWPEAYALLSARWRATYTPSRLAQDWTGAGPLSRDAVERIEALLAAGAPLVRQGEAFRLPVGTDRAALVVPEDGLWRVDALE